MKLNNRAVANDLYYLLNPKFTLYKYVGLSKIGLGVDENNGRQTFYPYEDISVMEKDLENIQRLRLKLTL